MAQLISLSVALAPHTSLKSIASRLIILVSALLRIYISCGCSYSSSNIGVISATIKQMEPSTSGNEMEKPVEISDSQTTTKSDLSADLFDSDSDSILMAAGKFI